MKINDIIKPMNKQNKIQIYLDLDEVVADFSGYVRSKLGGEPVESGYRFPLDQWKRITADPRLYSKLSIKEGAMELIEWCSNFQAATKCELAFLTALPRKNDVKYAASDKVLWCHKYFPAIPCFIGPYSQDKHTFVEGSNSILIDDRLDNCTQWRDAGGRAHQYKNWEACKPWLSKELLGNTK
jgi:hypothetical protein